MPHIDEGLLHWYLDEYEGTERQMLPDELRDAMAHVDQCADCTALLEKARAIRVGAEGILSGAQPKIEKPPFEQVVARANARRHDRRQFTWMRRGRTLGLAATVFLAVGAGWMLRARFPSSVAPQPAVSEVSDVAAPAIAELNVPTADSLGAGVRLGQAQPADQRREQLEERDQLAKQTAPETQATAEGAGVRADQPDEARRRQVAPAPAAAAPSEREEAMRVAREAPAEPLVRDADVSVFANLEPLPMESVAEILDAVKAGEEFKDDARVQVSGAVAFDEESSWLLVDRATAEQAVGPLAIIPSASIESIRMGEWSGTTAVIVSQRVGDAVVTLLEWRMPPGNEQAYRQLEATPTDRAAGDAGSDIIVRTMGDLVIAARADLRPDSLAVLLDLVERE
jgi:hypothetical protein